jgi:hypothetical protein
VREIVKELLGELGRSLERRVKDVWMPLTSFRDVDEGIDFGSPTSASLVTRIRAR